MKDTFGLSLLSCLKDTTTVHELERDDGRIEVFEVSWYYAPFKQWHPIEQELANRARGRILEVGCGSGRVMKHFQDEGHEIVGIDLSELAMEAARRFGAWDCRLMDARAMDFPENSFDTAALLGNGFGLGGNVDDCRKILSGLSRVVKPSSLLIATSRDPERTDNPRHLAYHELNRGLGKPIGAVRLRVNFDGDKGEWFDLLLVEIKAIDAIIKGTGWTLEKVIEARDPLDSRYGVILKNTD